MRDAAGPGLEREGGGKSIFLLPMCLARSFQLLLPDAVGRGGLELARLVNRMLRLASPAHWLRRFPRSLCVEPAFDRKLQAEGDDGRSTGARSTGVWEREWTWLG